MWAGLVCGPRVTVRLLSQGDVKGVLFTLKCLHLDARLYHYSAFSQLLLLIRLL